MEKSIENIWKEGFLSTNALVAPRINQLYEQKSTHLIDRLLRTGKRNSIGIVIGAAVVLIAFALIQSWMAGLLLCAILLALAYSTYLNGQRLKQINKGLSSYHFLLELHLNLQRMTNTYARIYQWLYPVIVLIFGFGLLYSRIGMAVWQKVGDEFPGASQYFGLPSVAFYAVLGFAAVVALCAKPLYRIDIGLIYGPILNKLEEMKNEIELLKKE